MASGMFTWSILFITVFGFLIGVYGLSVSALNVDYEGLNRPPEPPENFSNIPILGDIEYGAYMAYYIVERGFAFVIFIVGAVAYANNLVTFGIGIPIPIIGLIVTIATVFIIYEGIKLIRGTS